MLRRTPGPWQSAGDWPASIWQYCLELWVGWVFFFGNFCQARFSPLHLQLVILTLNSCFLLFKSASVHCVVFCSYLAKLRKFFLVCLFVGGFVVGFLGLFFFASAQVALCNHLAILSILCKPFRALGHQTTCCIRALSKSELFDLLTWTAASAWQRGLGAQWDRQLSPSRAAGPGAPDAMSWGPLAQPGAHSIGEPSLPCSRCLADRAHPSSAGQQNPQCPLGPGCALTSVSVPLESISLSRRQEGKGWKTQTFLGEANLEKHDTFFLSVLNSVCACVWLKCLATDFSASSCFGERAFGLWGLFEEVGVKRLGMFSVFRLRYACFICSVFLMLPDTPPLGANVGGSCAAALGSDSAVTVSGRFATDPEQSGRC